MTRARTAGVVSVLVLPQVLWGHAARALAAPSCGSSSRPQVEVVVPTDLPPTLAPFVALLRAELASRGMDLCPASTSASPIAVIEVLPKAGAVGLTVEVRDAVTAKRVSRDLSLERVPTDGQPLMVALAADELLRASWAELALRSAPAPTAPVPNAVAEAVRADVMPSPGAGVALGVVLTGEHFSSGTTLYGADARVSLALTSRLSLSARIGLRASPTVTAADGDIGTTAFVAGVATAFTLTPPERAWGVDAVACLGYDHLSFTPTPNAAATGHAETGDALLAEAGLDAGVHVLPRLRLGIEVLAEVPLRSVEVTDARNDAAGVAGIGFAAGLGVWSAF